MAADTDNASQLVAQLLEKLASLDNKVQLYRQDMAQEFQRYSRELLEDVPKDVAAKVEQTVADSLHNYPVLNPGFTDLACSLQSDQIVDPIKRIELDRRARAGSRSPPPKLPHTSGVPREQYGDANNSSGPRSPHEREREFHDTSALSSSSLNTVTTLRPDPTRRHTEETLSSVTSDDSNSRSRPRSALRRSSSSSTKTQSPRRVRFEVEGTEVLPTMSPMLSPRLSDLPSPLNNEDRVLGQIEEATSLQGSLRSDYNDDTPVTELLGSSPPGPKKVSSTDRLKALARSSKEDTSKWTVVGDLQGSDDSEDELVMGGRSSRQRGALSQAPIPAQPAQPTMTQPVAHRTNDPRLPSQLSSSLPVVQEHDETADTDEEEYDSDDSDESDELMMPARKSTKGLQPRASAGISVPLAQSASTAASTETTEASRSSEAPSISSTATSTSEDASEADEDEEEDMFGFDDENQPASKSANQTTPKKYIDEEDEDEESESDSPVVTPMRKAAVPSSLPRSVNMAKVGPPPKSPTSAMASTMMGTSMGSYKGRPIILGSVKNEQLHEQASRMGNFTSFVGSVDGRTGVDEKGSYRPEGMAFAGVPKSLSERMLREELEEEEVARRTGSTPT